MIGATILVILFIFALEYGLRGLFFALSLKFDNNLEDNRTKSIIFFLSVIWLIFFPNILFVSWLFKLPKFTQEIPTLIVAGYLLLTLLPFIILWILGLRLRARKQQLPLTKFDGMIAGAIVVFLFGYFLLNNWFYTEHIVSNAAINIYKNEYQLAKADFLKSENNKKGFSDPKGLLKTLINYDIDTTNINSLEELFNPYGILFDYEQNTNPESSLAPLTGYSLKEKREIERVTTEKIINKFKDGLKITLGDDFSNRKTRGIQAFHSIGDYIKEGAYYYSYGASTIKKVNNSKCLNGSIYNIPDFLNNYDIYSSKIYYIYKNKEGANVKVENIGRILLSKYKANNEWQILSKGVVNSCEEIYDETYDTSSLEYISEPREISKELINEYSYKTEAEVTSKENYLSVKTDDDLNNHPESVRIYGIAKSKQLISSVNIYVNGQKYSALTQDGSFYKNELDYFLYFKLNQGIYTVSAKMFDEKGKEIHMISEPNFQFKVNKPLH